MTSAPVENTLRLPYKGRQVKTLQVDDIYSENHMKRINVTHAQTGAFSHEVGTAYN